MSFLKAMGYAETFDEFMGGDLKKDNRRLVELYTLIENDMNYDKIKWHPDHRVAVIGKAAEVDYVKNKAQGFKRSYFENENLDLECPMIDGKEEGV
ncbi:MAG: hypothetical protein A2Y03_01895 [Omnitrophica WOR_2 bacterium GWF2_38_59]|nr:MAG: hypothetical protein A2Y03_01895 [Omnitrophica WOR_2 bacterium GWF2_38_59]OGX55293.1 MAG: hypothetical protein A2447_00680 [Omnitrophica WOR_2 bacterium RIFOXYC2_FULL_38_12]HBG61721.1 hypothetical protein [Candidatus Omnitrophota bacterium]